MATVDQLPRNSLSIGYFVEQTPHATVDVITHEHLFAVIEEPRQTYERGHPGSEGKTSTCTLEHGDLLFQRSSRRIATPSVVVLAKRSRIGLLKRGGLVERRRRRLVRVIWSTIEDDRLGEWMEWIGERFERRTWRICRN